MDLVPFYWAGSAVLGTLGFGLARAAERFPDPMNAGFDKPLNRMLTSLVSGGSLVIVAVLAVYRFGLIWPFLAAVALYVTYRMVLFLPLNNYYKLMLPISAVALLCAILLLSSAFLGRTGI